MSSLSRTGLHIHHHAHHRKAGLAPWLVGVAVLLVLVLAWRRQCPGCATPGTGGASFVTHVGPQGGAGARSAAVDLTMGHVLLPLTNLSGLTTVALLDAAGDVSGEDIRGLVRLHQALFCSARLHKPDPPGTEWAKFGNASMLVYGDNDIVSNNLKGTAKTWEDHEVKEMVYAMKAPVPASPRDVRRPDAWRAPASPFVVDIGANIGWFTFNAAVSGGTVAAFEAMPSNVRLVRSSLCANPRLMERVALYGTGLGTKRTQCYIVSGKVNRGDGHTLCDDKRPHKEVEAEWKERTGYEYEVRGEMSVVRLDGLIAHDIQVIKIDVEGYETQVLKGAERLLKKHNAWFIMTECNTEILKKEGQVEFLRFMDGLGYYLSSRSFKGPFHRVEDVKRGIEQELPSISLYCVRKELLDAKGGPEWVLRPNGGRRALQGGGSSGARRA